MTLCVPRLLTSKLGRMLVLSVQSTLYTHDTTYIGCPTVREVVIEDIPSSDKYLRNGCGTGFFKKV